MTLAELARSLPSVSELIPTYEAIGPTEARLSAQGRDSSSVTRSELSRINTASDIGGLPQRTWSNCIRFHEEISDAADSNENARPSYRPIVEFVQPTAVWASVEPAGVTLHKPDDFEDRGDGTVPRWSATPPDAQATVTYVTGKHAGLQQTTSVFRQIRGILTERVGEPPTLRAPSGADDQISVEAPELIEAGGPFPIVAESYEGYEDMKLTVSIDEGETRAMQFDTDTGFYRAELAGILEPGVHQWVAASSPSSDYIVEPVTDLIYVT